MDTTVFSMDLQYQCKYGFSATQDKNGAMKVQALITVCAGEWLSMLNILFHVSMILWPIVTLHGKTVNKVNARARHVSTLKQKERDSTR